MLPGRACPCLQHLFKDAGEQYSSKYISTFVKTIPLIGLSYEYGSANGWLQAIPLRTTFASLEGGNGGDHPDFAVAGPDIKLAPPPFFQKRFASDWLTLPPWILCKLGWSPTGAR